MLIVVGGFPPSAHKWFRSAAVGLGRLVSACVSVVPPCGGQLRTALPAFCPQVCSLCCTDRSSVLVISLAMLCSTISMCAWRWLVAVGSVMGPWIWLRLAGALTAVVLCVGFVLCFSQHRVSCSCVNMDVLWPAKLWLSLPPTNHAPVACSCTSAHCGS